MREIKRHLRRLETLGRPVVAAINGAALGGGLEIALAAHHRIVARRPQDPVRVPRGAARPAPRRRRRRALGADARDRRSADATAAPRPAPHAREGARSSGSSTSSSPTRDELIPAAKAWIAANPDAVQPWDVAGLQDPRRQPADPPLAANLPAFPANLRKQLKGANYPAPHHIMAAAVEGAQVDFDNASEIEGRYFVDLVTSQVAKNMIQAFFFDLQRVNGERGRPDGVEPFQATQGRRARRRHDGRRHRLCLRKAGIQVVLKDVSLEAAERGKGYSQKLVDQGRRTGPSSQEKATRSSRASPPTADPADAAGADLVIEAVFEDPRSRRRCSPKSSRTSRPMRCSARTPPRCRSPSLAEGVSRPADFIGLHFFSPVDKMPLLEIIKGEQTCDETLYRALDFARQIKKTPIVVNDSRGFFTSRVIGTFIDEGIAMLAEGVPPPSIEQASCQAGYPAPVLQLTDELNMKLMRKIRNAAEGRGEADGGLGRHPAEAVIDRMLDESAGRAVSRGWLLRVRRRQARRLWPGLRRVPAGRRPVVAVAPDLEERMLFIEALETVKCFDEGVIESVADANIGSIIGIGFPGWTGGVLQYINGYDGGPARLRGPCPRARRTLRRALRAARLARRAGRARRDVHRRRAARGRVIVPSAR